MKGYQNKCEWIEEYIGIEFKIIPFVMDIPKTKYHRNIKNKKIKKY